VSVVDYAPTKLDLTEVHLSGAPPHSAQGRSNDQMLAFLRSSRPEWAANRCAPILGRCSAARHDACGARIESRLAARRVAGELVRNERMSFIPSEPGRATCLAFGTDVLVSTFPRVAGVHLHGQPHETRKRRIEAWEVELRITRDATPVIAPRRSQTKKVLGIKYGLHPLAVQDALDMQHEHAKTNSARAAHPSARLPSTLAG
jgi:hypothetical protein